MRSSAVGTLSRFCARRVVCWSAFPLVPKLCSTGSSVDCPTSFAGSTMAEADFPHSCIIGYGSSPSRCGLGGCVASSRTREASIPMPHRHSDRTSRSLNGASRSFEQAFELVGHVRNPLAIHAPRNRTPARSAGTLPTASRTRQAGRHSVMSKCGPLSSSTPLFTASS